MTIDGDTVVIPEGDQLAQTQRTGPRTGRVGNAFHQATVAHEDPGVVIDDLVTIAVELGGQGTFGNCHAHGIGDALPERASGGLDARCIAIFRMARGF